MKWVGVRSGRISREKGWQRKQNLWKQVLYSSQPKAGISSSVMAGALPLLPLCTYGELFVMKRSHPGLKADLKCFLKHFKEIDEGCVCVQIWWEHLRPWVFLREVGRSCEVREEVYKGGVLYFPLIRHLKKLQNVSVPCSCTGKEGLSDSFCLF